MVGDASSARHAYNGTDAIADLERDARILYSSDSIIDILGYTPDEVVNKSAWDFFSEDELPYARQFHEKRVLADKAAVLAYCRVKDKNGTWIGCECCFTIVYDVMVVCTSVYRRGTVSQSECTSLHLLLTVLTDPRASTRSACRSAHLLFITARSSIPHAVTYISKVRARRKITTARTTGGAISEQIYTITDRNVRNNRHSRHHWHSGGDHARAKFLLLHC